MVSFGGLARKIFGSSNDRRVKGTRFRVDQITALEPEMQALSDEQLRERTVMFRKQLADGATLDQLMVPAFATVREAARRALGMRPFDVQLIGGMVLHEGSIAEMRTGEGKTLVATFPAYLNALTGKGVHVVTVNDYLARRDAEWMGRVYGFLGLTTGIIVHGLTDEQRRDAYACDITYATNNELGFDYLRDNMKYERGEMVQRGHNFAIVDEVDSILIDEARTPLIISGPLEDRSEMYNTVDRYIIDLVPEDYEIDEKQRTSIFTEIGTEKMENKLRDAGLLKGESLYDVENVAMVHHVNNALKAHRLFQKDRDYIVRNNEIVIIDEFTGRMMPGRRYSEGLHQALEAKEHVAIQPENQTLASVTFQNYFRLYKKLAGMTGTANTEAEEFGNIYGLDVVEIPTNLPVKREDFDDEVYRTVEEKYRAIVKEIRDAHERGQPVLVGTVSIEKSEQLADRLRKEGFNQFQVLNARHHEREAQIVAQAGKPGTITIATNMAGRGTDIVLGGNLKSELAALGEVDAATIEAAKAEWQRRHEEVLAAGGLHIIGTERHESRRIDNQLRGRSGRQGDPGSSRFYLSLEDNLMRIFGDPEKTKRWLTAAGMKAGEVIESPMLSRQIERAQRKVEAYNFDLRKNLLEYDDVANDQRKVIYQQRTEIMGADDMSDSISGIRVEVVNQLIDQYVPRESTEEDWNLDGLAEAIARDFQVQVEPKAWLAADHDIAEAGVRERVVAAVEDDYRRKAEQVGPLVMAHLEKAVMLQELDKHWREHLAAMDYLRQGIHLRAYAQKNPKQEYKREAFEMFGTLLDRIKHDAISLLSRLQVRTEAEVEAQERERQEQMARRLQAQHVAPQSVIAGDALPVESGGDSGGSPILPGPSGEPVAPLVRDGRKVGRNEPCPCGSGRKFKHCHGQLAREA